MLFSYLYVNPQLIILRAIQLFAGSGANLSHVGDGVATVRSLV